MLRVFMAGARVLMITRPASSTATVTGDSCGRPSERKVASTARWWEPRNARARAMASSLMSALERRDELRPGQGVEREVERHDRRAGVLGDAAGLTQALDVDGMHDEVVPVRRVAVGRVRASVVPAAPVI